jgi:hypothetical protein
MSSAPLWDRLDDLVVQDRGVGLDQEPVVLGIRHRLLEVLAGHGPHGIDRRPEAQDGQLGAVTVVAMPRA